MNGEYLPRITDKILEEYLEAFGAVLIVGPKWCGKTTTAEQYAASAIKLQDQKRSKQYLMMADLDPARLLQGGTPRLIDEWQMAPVLWDTIRAEVDERGEAGQFILTGSAVPVDDGMSHTGTGRVGRLRMYPMSLYESGESNGRVSLMDLFDTDADVDGVMSSLTIDELAFIICRGGWPAAIKRGRKSALLLAEGYIQAICESDVSRVDASKRSPQRVRAILRAYARKLSTLARKKSIIDDVAANDMNLSESTFYEYLNILNRLFVLQDIPAWCPSIRSKSAIRAGNKIGFTDPSLAAAALGLTPERLLNDLETFGFFFESLCIRDLRIYSQEMGGHVSYYRDRYGLESDCVLHLKDGRYALIEVKLGSRQIEEGAAHLLELAALIRKHNESGSGRLDEPAVLIVLTGGEYAYRRKDGVYVIPVGCLKD